MSTFIAWTGTDGSLNVQNFQTAQKQILNQTSNYGPALAFYNGLLYLAWTGTDRRLNLISSSDGIHWGNQITLDQTSNFGPALAASGSLLSLVWIGTDGRLNLYFSSDGSNWVNQITLGQTSGYAPAAAAGPFQALALAWTEVNGTMMALSGSNALAGIGIDRAHPVSTTGPALAFYQNLFYVAHIDINQNIELKSSSDGLIWSHVNPPPKNQTSKAGLALTASSNLLSLAWTGTNQQLNVVSSTDGTTWGSITTVLYDRSNLAPAIALTTF